MARQHSLLIFPVLLIGLSACTEIYEPQLVASPDKVSLMLAESADKASNALQTLAAIEQARSPGIAVGTIPDAPPELRRAMTIDWIGPAEELVIKLAGRAGYTFMTFGAAPPVPLVVNISAENKPVVDILRDVGLQLGQRADVKVDAIRKAVELHYAPVARMGN
ncbi:MAG: hypothetical protein EOM26_06205 [Alphaproteobacteria bacterium]|nr:hypothetical protein [Alphaproteobacteria bacterium]